MVIPAHPQSWHIMGGSGSFPQLKRCCRRVSCPVIQSLLKSVRMLPLESLQAVLTTCLAFPCSVLCHCSGILGERKERAAAAKHLGQTDWSDYVLQSSLETLLEINKERSTTEINKEKTYLSSCFLSLFTSSIFSVFEKLKLQICAQLLRGKRQ